jgi:hypothetical protein
LLPLRHQYLAVRRHAGSLGGPESRGGARRPIWKANEIGWRLDRRFYAPGQVHYRVTRASLDALNDLLAQGLALNAARSVMRRFHARDQLPPSDLHREQMD